MPTFTSFSSPTFSCRLTLMVHSIISSAYVFNPAVYLCSEPMTVAFPAAFLLVFTSYHPRDYSSSTVAFVSVPPAILQLLPPERNHHWCIPFTVTGNPKPELRWYHNNTTLEEQDFIRTIIHEYTENEDHGCLQLVNPTHIHNGKYRLVVKNEFGQDEKTVSAQFIDPPYFNTTGRLTVPSCKFKFRKVTALMETYLVFCALFFVTEPEFGYSCKCNIIVKRTINSSKKCIVSKLTAVLSFLLWASSASYTQTLVCV